MTRYYVNMAPSLVTAIQEGTEGYKLPEGWRMIERFGPRFEQTECWIVEDDGAGTEFEDFLVLPTFTVTLNNPNDPEDNSFTVTVFDREIVKSP